MPFPGLGGSGAGGIPDAVSDGQTYGRKNAGWAVVTAGGSAYAEAANFAALPSAASNSGITYLVRAAQGVYFVNRKPPGLYTSDGSNWIIDNDASEAYFQDTLAYTNLTSVPSGLTQIGALTPSNDDFLQRKAGAWTNRTVAQVKSDLGTMTPATHATSHQSGGGDPIALDTLAAPTDITTLNASTSAHGLSPKATAPASGLLSVHAIGNGETGRTDKALFDTTNPAALGTASPGTQLVAARRDHVHALPALDALSAATDITTANASTTMHGLLIKATAPAAGLRNVLAIDNAETVYKNAALFDDTNTAALGTAAPGSAMAAARRDHVHAIPVVGTRLEIQVACSDSTTAITAATGKVTFRMPCAMTLTEVRASMSTAPTGSTAIINVKESGTTIFSTKLTFDAGQTSCGTAAQSGITITTLAVLSDSSLADNAPMTVDFDQVGSTVAGIGVVLTLIGTRA